MYETKKNSGNFICNSVFSAGNVSVINAEDTLIIEENHGMEEAEKEDKINTEAEEEALDIIDDDWTAETEEMSETEETRETENDSPVSDGILIELAEEVPEPDLEESTEMESEEDTEPESEGDTEIESEEDTEVETEMEDTEVLYNQKKFYPDMAEVPWHSS